MKLSNIKFDRRQIITIVFIVVVVVFFILFIYFLMTMSNNLVGFRVIKDYGPLNKDGIPNFNELKDKYKLDKCEKVCKQEFCSEYQIQRIKYDLCKDCKSQGKCYDQYKGICVPCENTYTCEELFGCSGNKPPIDPLENYCTRCWLGGDDSYLLNNNSLFLSSSSARNSSASIPSSSKVYSSSLISSSVGNSSAYIPSSSKVYSSMSSSVGNSSASIPSFSKVYSSSLRNS